MKCHAYYEFTLSPKNKNDYVLINKSGDIPEFILATYADTEENRKLEISRKSYVRFTVPRAASIRKYFAYTFELSYGKVLTSTEGLDEQNRTFGDAKKIGINDLILIKFSRDRLKLEMWFIQDMGTDKNVKHEYFDRWVNGESIDCDFPSENKYQEELKQCLRDYRAHFNMFKKDSFLEKISEVVFNEIEYAYIAGYFSGYQKGGE